MFSYFFLQLTPRHIIFRLKNLIFFKNFVLKFYFARIISTPLWEKGRIRIREAQKHPDPDPQHWLLYLSFADQDLVFLLMVAGIKPLICKKFMNTSFFLFFLIEITVLLRQGSRQQSRVKKYIIIWCAFELGKCKSEDGTTPPLARKLPQRFADLFASS